MMLLFVVIVRAQDSYDFQSVLSQQTSSSSSGGSSLVLKYIFATSGTPSSITDSSGNGHTLSMVTDYGSPASETTLPSYSTGAIVFTSNQHGSIVSPSTLPSATSSWTVEAWVNSAGLTHVLTWGDSAGNYVLCEINSGIYSDDQAGYIAGSTTGWVANTTYMYAWVYNGTSLSLYLNGSLVAGPTTHTFGSWTGNSAFMASNMAGGDTSGTIGFVEIFNIAKNGTQISTDYSSGPQ